MVVHTTGNDGEAEDATAADNNETDLIWTHKSHLPSANDSTWVMLTGGYPFGIPLVIRQLMLTTESSTCDFHAGKVGGSSRWLSEKSPLSGDRGEAH